MRRGPRATGVAGEVLITLGLLVLLFLGWQLWWTDVTAGREQAATVRSLERELARKDPGIHPRPVAFGAAFAILRVPRFGSSWARPVLEGTSHDVLAHGVGHYPGTAMPGQVGNFAVAGHRTTYGRPFTDIDKLRTGDLVIVETRSAYAVYAVQRHVIVTPEHVEVAAPVPQHPGERPTQAWMTMTACHPRFSAAQRYVVFARLLRTVPHADGIPSSLMAVNRKAG
jgi:sortase A